MKADGGLDIQDAYKISEYFAKPYCHKYGTEIHDVSLLPFETGVFAVS
jgi:hypothetical protein